MGGASNQYDAAHAGGFEQQRGIARILEGIVGAVVRPTRLDAEIPLQGVVHGVGFDLVPGDEYGQTGLLGDVRAIAQSLEQERLRRRSRVFRSKAALAAAAQNHDGLCAQGLLQVQRRIAVRQPSNASNSGPAGGRMSSFSSVLSCSNQIKSERLPSSAASRTAAAAGQKYSMTARSCRESSAHAPWTREII